MITQFLLDYLKADGRTDAEIEQLLAQSAETNVGVLTLSRRMSEARVDAHQAARDSRVRLRRSMNKQG